MNTRISTLSIFAILVPVTLSTTVRVELAFAGPGVGACCLADGTCVELDPETCDALGGAFHGLDSACPGTMCFGACCAPHGSCSIRSPGDCGDDEFIGLGTFCGNVDCVGACCNPYTGCSDVGTIGCAQGGGEFRGRGTSCASTECFGACCLPEKSCLGTTAGACAQFAGTYQGDGTVCLEDCPSRLATGFSYQGQLRQNGSPYSGPANIGFSLWDLPMDGQLIAGPVAIGPVAVENGLFQTIVDFGEGAVNGNSRWLEVAVCTEGCGGPQTFTPLQPRQLLAATPYALQTRGLFVNELGHVGVGTKNPSNRLTVAGHADFSGNVGIGTTTPAAQLDVNGAVRTTTLEITGGSPLQQPLAGWGFNFSGQTTVPTGTFTAVAAGLNHSLAIRSDGTLAGWGDNSSGQVNIPSGTFTAVAAGWFHSLAIRNDGTLVGWGDNGDGQINVPAGTFTRVSAGFKHSLAIRSDGALAGWGRNVEGQINIPSGTFTAVAAGGNDSLAIRSDGTLVGWGANNYDILINIPAGTFTAVASGVYHGLAIRSDGTLAGWGRNLEGQINVPAGTFTAVAGGLFHSLAIRGDGTLVGWGNNGNGQINVPAGTLVAVAAGERHSLAIRRDSANQPALLLRNNSAYKPGSDRWTISSDRRLKKNIEPLSGALERLLQLHGVTFQWLDPASQGGITGTQMGLIADEVQRAFPQWVGRDPKGYQTLTVGGFEALTAEALRDLRQEKDAAVRKLQEENTELREMLKRATERIDALDGGR